MLYQILTIGLLLVLIYRTRKDNDMSEALDRLTAEVAEMDTVVDSAITTIKGLAQQIRDAISEPAALQRLADDLDARAANLGAAIAESTTLVTEPVPPEVITDPPAGTDSVTGSGDTVASDLGGDETISTAAGNDSVDGGTGFTDFAEAEAAAADQGASTEPGQ